MRAEPPGTARSLILSYSLTRAVSGKTYSRFLSPRQAEVAQEQVKPGRKFRSQVEDYWEACEQQADSQLEDATVASEAAAGKGGFQRTSRPRLGRP